MGTIGQARLLASNKVVDRVKEDLIKTWPRSALLGCAADGFTKVLPMNVEKLLRRTGKVVQTSLKTMIGCAIIHLTAIRIVST